MTFAAPCDLVFVDDAVVPSTDARLSVHANAVSYGTGTFEGIRASWNETHEELYLLEATAHYDRLHRSARILGMPLPLSTSALVDATIALLRANEVRYDAYVRPLLVQSGDLLPVRMHDVQTRLSIAVTPMPGDYIDADGVRCMTSTWRRTPDVCAPNRAKTTGSYLGPALAKTEAIRNGYDEAIMLTTDGFVAEATTSNVFLRFGSEWVTPPATDDILEGITRAEVMELLPGVTVRRVHRSEAYACDEMFLCGTAVVVAPVVSLDGRHIGAGSTTLNLNRRLRDIARCSSDWTTPVYA
jgi:branched-chain amino acid aminotransferase